MSAPVPENEDPRWLDDPANVEKIWRLVCVSCILLTLADLGYHKHGHYAFEGLIGFHGIFGFIAFIFVVLAGTWMREHLMRDEDYYDEQPPAPAHDHGPSHEGGH
ncbi:MAG: hypothetical protein P8R54_02070 [Myxococcota bacterium]|nr:hypothetical protein [Myxococcota bacterium]